LSSQFARVIVKAVPSPRRFLFALFVGVIAACGARTGLFVPSTDDGYEKAVGHPQDSSIEDVRSPAQPVKDALPPVVVVPPRPVSDCPDAGATLIYVVTVSNQLMSFYPPTAAFAPIGKLACTATDPAATPFSMAVDHTGVAYVVFSDGELFRVSTSTAACQRTGFTTGGTFATTFGMAYVKDNTGTGETLYVAEADLVSPSPSRLGWIDTKRFTLNIVGVVSPPVFNAELTGTGAGELFSFDAPSPNTDAAISRIDKGAARVTARSVLPGLHQGTAWAFAFWGGDFYTFTAPVSGTVVTRFRPSDGSIVQVAQLADQVVGAGVSTCAPQL
jgi:hypothetical protein